MLIEFSVANFRSFREKQTLSMVAAPRLHRKENVFTPILDGEVFPSLLKVAVIYGPNASGKSNLLKALSTVLQMTWRVPGNDYDLPVTPFVFDRELASLPSEFELHFFEGKQRYQFNLALTSKRVTHERLFYFPKGKESLLYERKYVGDTDTYTFGPALKTSTSIELLEAWIQLTPSKLLFIAQAVANSRDAGAVLNGPFKWLRGGAFAMLDGMTGMSKATRELLAVNESHASSITSFLEDIDVPISKIRVEQKDDASKAQLGLINSKATPEVKATFLTHRSDLGDAELRYEDESEGTKNLIGFWLPWIATRPKTPEDTRNLLIVDELDSSLHPNVVSVLIEKHINAEDISQLIFTTHDTHLMDAKLLRRDQFWIVERDKNAASKLRSIYDFKGREGEDIEKRYYEGLYRGLPITKQILQNKPSEKQLKHG